MSTSHTMNIADLTNQDAVHRLLTDVRDHRASYFLVQDGEEVAKVIPVEKKNEMTPEELRKKRQETLEKMDVLAKKVARLWNSDETAAEAVANDRR